MMIACCDIYPLAIPYKGGITYAMWTTVYITTNLLSVDEMFPNATNAQRAALKSRFDVVVTYVGADRRQATKSCKFITKE